MHATVDPYVGRRIGERFVVERQLGRGGMGSVYLARHDVLDRPFAVKVIRAELLSDPSVKRRFRREARMASRLSHPSITTVFDFGYLEDGAPYLVMEYAAGPTVADILDQKGPFELSRGLQILVSAADALRAAHQSGIIHRDLKPQNMILTRGPTGEDLLKIVDFGLAKLINARTVSMSTKSNEQFGTPSYMAPEQCLDGDVDYRSDIYALGIVAYELFVGKPPFRGTMINVMNGHLKSDPPRPSEEARRPELSPVIDQLILTCLEKDPNARFQDAGLLRDELEDQLKRRMGYLNHVPTQPIPQMSRVDALNVEHETRLPTQRYDDAIALNSEASLAALEELICRLRELKIGGPNLALGLARLLVLKAQGERLNGELRSQRRTEQDWLDTSANRRSNLYRALRQLEQERQLAESAGHRSDVDEITEMVDQLASMIGDLDRESESQLAMNEKRFFQLGKAFNDNSVALEREAGTLRSALMPFSDRLERLDDEAFAELLRAAGIVEPG